MKKKIPLYDSTNAIWRRERLADVLGRLEADCAVALMDPEKRCVESHDKLAAGEVVLRMIPDLQSKLRVNPDAEEIAAMALHVGLGTMFVMGIKDVRAAIVGKLNLLKGPKRKSQGSAKRRDRRAKMVQDFIDAGDKLGRAVEKTAQKLRESERTIRRSLPKRSQP